MQKLLKKIAFWWFGAHFSVFVSFCDHRKTGVWNQFKIHKDINKNRIKHSFSKTSWICLNLSISINKITIQNPAFTKLNQFCVGCRKDTKMSHFWCHFATNFFSLTPQYKKTIDFLIIKVIWIGTYIYWLSKNQLELTELHLRIFLFHPKQMFSWIFRDDPFSENYPLTYS